MTVLDTTSRNQYIATSGQTIFPYTFEVFVKEDIAVLKNGILLAEGTNYTVSGVGSDPGGNVTLTVGATAGDVLTIYRDMGLQRETDYQNSGDFLAQEVNDDFDRLWLATQQLDGEVSRAIVKPVTDLASIDMTLPSASDRAESVLGFSATGAPVVGPTVADVTTIVDLAADIQTLADIEDGTVATDAISDTAAIAANVTTVAGISGNVTTVAGNTTNINTVAGDLVGADDIGTVATNIANVNATGANIADVVTVSGINADVTTVADNTANVTTVAGVSTNVTTVAGISADVTTVAGISANVTTVAGISADVTTAAINVADITNFADVYQGGKTADPSLRNDGSALQDGDLYFNTTNDLLRVYSDSIWRSAVSEQGIPPVWDTDTVYPEGGWAKSPVDNEVYGSLVSANQNNEPSVSTTQWTLIGNLLKTTTSTGTQSLSDTLDDRIIKLVNVAAMVASNLQSSDAVRTNAYATNGGGSDYICKTAAQAIADGDIVDEKKNHTLNNGNVVIQTEPVALPHATQSGAIADGVTSDAALLNLLNSYGFIRTEGSSYGLGEPINILNDIVGGSFNYNGVAQAFNFAVDNSSIKNVTVSSSKHGLQHTNMTRGNDLRDSKITADGYGVLINDSANGSSKMRVVFNDIFSNTADAIELNNPTRGSKGYMAVGNWLHADVSGVSTNSGFSVGIAGIDGHITAFNRSSESREEAYHVEDSQLSGIQIGNIWDGCLKDGSFIGGQFEGEPLGDGLVSVGNRYKHTGGLGGSVGLHYVFPTANGSLDMCTGVSNYMSDFGTGLSLPSKSLSYHSGNVVVGSVVAVKQLLSSVCVGDNICKDADTLFEGDGASLIGGVHSKSKPTNVAVNTGPATQIGSAIKRFSWKTPYTHGGASATEGFDLFAAGDLINGSVNLILQNGTSNFVYSAKITWDGTTLTQSDKVSRSYGNIFGTINIIESGGRIVVQVGSAVAITSAQLIVDFDGFYFVK